MLWKYGHTTMIERTSLEKANNTVKTSFRNCTLSSDADGYSSLLKLDLI